MFSGTLLLFNDPADVGNLISGSSAFEGWSGGSGAMLATFILLFFHPFHSCTSKDVHHYVCLPVCQREEEEWGRCAPFLLRATLRGWTHPIGHTLVVWSHLAAREPGRCGLWLTCTQPKLPKVHRETDVKPKPTQLWTYKAYEGMVEWTLRIRKGPRSSLGHHGIDIFQQRSKGLD